MNHPTCEGCENLRVEPAGKGHVFFICSLGKSEWSSRPVFDYVPESVIAPTVPIPAWCRLGKGICFSAEALKKRNVTAGSYAEKGT